jgi:uracil-DNA glycosylase
VYLTTAVKCGKTGYDIKAGTIKECSKLLEAELELFPHLKAILLMGDVAIKAVNYILSESLGGRWCRLDRPTRFVTGSIAFGAFVCFRRTFRQVRASSLRRASGG